MNNIDTLLQHIQCDIHKLPIIYINKDGQAPPEERCWCKKCPIQQPVLIERVFEILDILAPKQELLQGLFNKVNSEWMNLKQRIMGTIELIFASYDLQLQSLNYTMSSLNKYLNYREFAERFQKEDLQKIGHMIYREDSSQSKASSNAIDLYQIPYIKQQLLDQFSKIKSNLVIAFDDLKQYLLSKNLQTQSKIIRAPPQPQVQNQQSQVNQQSRVIQNGKPPQPPQKSVILGSGVKLVYEKKCDQKADGLINCICINSQGSLFMQGLYPNRPGDPNVAIKQIDSYSKIQNCSQQICGTGEITCIAYNENESILIISDSESKISCWQNFDSNQWKMTQTMNKAHDARIISLLIFNNQLFSSSEDKTIKCWKFTNKYDVQYTIYVPAIFLNPQINSQGDHLAAIGKDEILLWQNDKALPPISVPEPRSFCFVGDRIMIGTAQSTIETYERNGNEYKQVNSPKPMNLGEIKQIIFSDAQRQILLRTEKKILIYLYTFNNLMMPQQEITGCYDQAYLQSGKTFSHIILYEEQETKIHYYAYKK